MAGLLRVTDVLSVPPTDQLFATSSDSRSHYPTKPSPPPSWGWGVCRNAVALLPLSALAARGMPTPTAISRKQTTNTHSLKPLLLLPNISMDLPGVEIHRERDPGCRMGQPTRVPQSIGLERTVAGSNRYSVAYERLVVTAQ